MQFSRFFLDSFKPSIWVFFSYLSAEFFVSFPFGVFSGGKRTRTADICLAKAALYQLSYTPLSIRYFYWAILDLNQGPHPYQGCALTT